MKMFFSVINQRGNGIASIITSISPREFLVADAFHLIFLGFH